MRRRFWRAVMWFAMKRADSGYAPPLRTFQVSNPTLTTNSAGKNVTVEWTLP